MSYSLLSPNEQEGTLFNGSGPVCVSWQQGLLSLSLLLFLALYSIRLPDVWIHRAGGAWHFQSSQLFEMDLGNDYSDDKR